MRIAQINVTASLSTGRIAVQLCRLADEAGHGALLCHARDYAPSSVFSCRIGGKLTTPVHATLSRLTDREGFFSRRATQKLVQQLERYKPDLIHLHNLHGHYLHLPTLFAYLRRAGVPVLWTLHDSWAYTGHCAYYTTAVGAPPLHETRSRSARHTVGCDRWQGGCGQCVCRREYPASWLLDQSTRNWLEKRDLFTGIDGLELAVPSEWLAGEVRRSFLQRYPLHVLPNGLDLTTFRACPSEQQMDLVVRSLKLDRVGGRKLVLSVAAVWEERKGLEDLLTLAEVLGKDYCVVAVGLADNQLAAIPKNTIMGLKRTGNVHELCALYTAADVYVSTSHEETMGMTLVEALACGTQVVCYDATAMPEIVTPEVGEVVPLGDIPALADAVRRLCDHPKSPQDCRKRAECYDADVRFGAYIRLYERMHADAIIRAENGPAGDPPPEEESPMRARLLAWHTRLTRRLFPRYNAKGKTHPIQRWLLRGRVKLPTGGTVHEGSRTERIPDPVKFRNRR